MAADSSPIAIDHEETWPAALLRLLESHLGMLTVYEERRHTIDLMSLSDRLVAGDPHYPFREQRAEIIREADGLVQGEMLLGYHCTRLLPHEIEEIRCEGLSPLSRDLIERRIRRAVAAGHLQPAIAARLLDVNEACAEGRNGRTYFIFTKSLLAEEGGVVWLLSCWGGEAIYARHEAHPATGACLRKLGVPCIVEAAIPVPCIGMYFSMGERLTAAYLERRRIRTGNGPDTEGWISQQMAVLRVIRRTDTEFEMLTGCKGWRHQI